MIAFTCASCQVKLSVKDELAGKKGKCPSCGAPVAIPQAKLAAATTFSASRDGRDRNVEDPKTLPPKAPAPAASEERTVAPANRDRTEQDSLVDGGPQALPGGGRTNSTTPAYHGQASNPDQWDFLAAPERPDEIGRLGAYRILKVLGAGGMGVVFQAEDPQLKRKLAIKAMLPGLAASGSAKQRFLREAQTAAAIEHDHIVPIFQVGEDRGVIFIAMPFLKGEPLDERLKRDPVLPIAEVLRIGREAANGLQAAHAAGLIHRDIKPANLWLEKLPGGPEPSGPGYRVKILDFGLAREAADNAQLTQQGAIVGTPAYMAPEQAAGQTIDGRCDLFSLGCVMYRMCTGEPPFAGTDMVSTLMAVATENPRPPLELRPNLPKSLSDLVLQLLAKKPEGRPASAQAVVEALLEIEKEPARPSVPKTAEEARLRAEPKTQKWNEPGTTQLEEIGTKSQRPALKRRIWPLWVAGGVMGLAALLIAIIIFWETPYGTVRIESNDPGVEIVFDQTGPTIKRPGDPPITLRAGEHGILVKHGDLKFETDKLELMKNKAVALKIELLQGKIQVSADGKVIGMHAIAPEAPARAEAKAPRPALLKIETEKSIAMPPRFTKRLDALMEVYLAKIGCSAIALGVEREGVPLYVRTVGFRDSERKVPADSQTMFGVGNQITFPFAMAAIRQLAEKNRLKLDDPILKLLDIKPAGDIVDPRVETITIENVFGQQTGWDTESVGLALQTARDRGIDKPSVEIVLGILATTRLKAAPGTKFLNFVFGGEILAHVITKMTGRSCGDYLRNNLFGKHAPGIAAPGSPEAEAAAVWNAKETDFCVSGQGALEFMRNYSSDGIPRLASPGRMWSTHRDNAFTLFMSWRANSLNVVLFQNGFRNGPSDELYAEVSKVLEELNVEAKRAIIAKSIDALMETYVAQIGCSAAVGVERNGLPVHLRAYGFRDQEGKLPATAETLFGVGQYFNSAFVAAGIRQLAGKKRLSLSDTVIKLLDIKPQGKIVDPRIESVTVENLIDQNSGWDDDLVRAARQTARDQGIESPGVEIVLSYLATARLKQAPGTKWQNSYFCIEILSHLLAKLTGQSCGDYYRKELFGKQVAGLAAPGSPEAQAASVWIAQQADFCISAPAALEFMRQYNALGRSGRGTGAGSWVGVRDGVFACYMRWGADGTNMVLLLNGTSPMSDELYVAVGKAIESLNP
jgi:serine/threonine protein kinase/CubicO group peptidase (beta-lactamase class C family)